MCFISVKKKIAALAVLLCGFILVSPSFAQDNSDNQVTISDLAAVDASAIGTLGVADGGFSADFWQTAEAESAISAIRSLPLQYETPELGALARVLLLSAAPIKAQTENDSHAFILARLQKLYDMGLYEDTAHMIESVPGQYFDNAFEEIAVNLQLQQGDYTTPCLRLPPPPQELPHSDSYFWQRLLFFCTIVEGSADEAELILNIMTEIEAFSDDFVVLARQALGISAVENGIGEGDRDAISAALQDRIAPPIFNAAEHYSPPYLHRLLRSNAVSDADKAIIGLRLHRASAISRSALAQIYEKIPLYRSRANAAYYTEQDYSHAYRSLGGAGDAADKAAIMQRLIAAGADSGNLFSIMAQTAPYLDTIADTDNIADADNEAMQPYKETLAIAELYRGNWQAAQKLAENGDKNIYDLLLFLAEPSATAPVHLREVYDARAILAIPPQVLITADKITDHRLITEQTWTALLLHYQSEEPIELTAPTVTEYIGRQFIITALKSDASADVIVSQSRPPQAQAVVQFLIHGDAIARSDMSAYLRMWQSIDADSARQVLLRYLLENGFWAKR